MMAEYCAACYSRLVWCRKCKTVHCLCSWNCCKTKRSQP